MNINQVVANLEASGKSGNPDIDKMLSRGLSLKEILTESAFNVHPEAFPGEPLTKTCARLMNERQH